MDDRFCKSRLEESGQNLFIFKKDFIGYAQRVLSFLYGEPYTMVCTVVGYALNKAVGVKNNTHGLVLFLLHSFLFAEPLMKIHLVDFVKAFLVKFARLPHLLRHLVEPTGIVVTHKLLDVVQLLIALDTREKPQKIKLGWIEDGRLYTVHNRYA